MAKLELALLIGAESKQFLADLSATVDRLEKLAGPAILSEVKAPVVSSNNKKSTTATKTKTTATTLAQAEEEFDLESEDSSTDDEDMEDENEKELSLDQLITLCRKKKPEAIKLLKKLPEKCFDLKVVGSVRSINTLKPAYYSKVAAELGA